MSPRPKLHAGASAVLWMLLSCFSSATMGAIAHALKAHTDWAIGALARALLGTIFALIAARAAGVRIVLRGGRTLWLRSFAGGLGIVCSFYAFARLPTADVLVLNYTAPLWLAVFAWLWLGQPQGWGVWAAIACGFAGVVLVERPHLAEKNFAAIVALVTGLTSAIAGRSISRLRHHFRPQTVVVHYSIVSTLVCLVVVGASPGSGALSRLPRAPLAWAMLGAVGLLGTLNQYAATRALSTGAATTVSAVSYAGVGFAFAYDRIFWSTPLEPTALLGIGLVVAPLVWLLRRPPDRSLVLHRRARVTGPIDEGSWRLGVDAAKLIEDAIARAESLTSCELRVHIERACSGDERVRARHVFDELSMKTTALRNAVLLYCARGERAVVVVADSAIAEIMAARAFEPICEEVHHALAGGEPLAASIAQGITRLGAELAEYFPHQADDVDELSNSVSYGPG